MMTLADAWQEKGFFAIAEACSWLEPHERSATRNYPMPWCEVAFGLLGAGASP